MNRIKASPHKPKNQVISPQLRLKKLCAENKKVWMGIINLSSNSFSTRDSTFKPRGDNSVPFSSRGLNAGSKLLDTVLKQAETLVKKGVHILDIGAVPTNPSIANALVHPECEFQTLFPVVCTLKKEFGASVLLSIDTYSPTVAHALASENLIDIINDIYGGRKLETISLGTHKKVQMNVLDVVSKFSLGYILMHMSGELDSLSHTQIQEPSLYLEKMLEFFQARKQSLSKQGINFCVFDPGIGGGRFGKNLELTLEILSEKFIQKLAHFGFPILIGLSRKSFLKDLYPQYTTPFSRDEISKEWELRCFEWGVKIVRTHVL